MDEIHEHPIQQGKPKDRNNQSRQRYRVLHWTYPQDKQVDTILEEYEGFVYPILPQQLGKNM